MVSNKSLLFFIRNETYIFLMFAFLRRVSMVYISVIITHITKYIFFMICALSLSRKGVIIECPLYGLFHDLVIVPCVSLCHAIWTSQPPCVPLCHAIWMASKHRLCHYVMSYEASNHRVCHYVLPFEWLLNTMCVTMSCHMKASKHCVCHYVLSYE